MARVEDGPSEEEDEPEVIIEDDATEQEEDNDNETEASDDLSDTEEENALEAKISELEEEVGIDPYQYDLHVQLIENYNKLSDLNRLRVAIERLHGLYPLRPEHWLLWTQTEMMMGETSEHRAAMHNMYERATNHFYYLPIYAQRLVYALRSGAHDVRAHYEVILRRVGYDPAAADIWSEVVEFEKSDLENQSLDEEDLREAVMRYARCLAEQLRRPLLNTDGVADKLRELETNHKSLLPAGYVDKVLAEHAAWSDVRDKIRSFEERLLVAEKDAKIDIYKEYLEELKQLHNSTSPLNDEPPFDSLEMIAGLYDRATSDCAGCERAAALLEEYSGFASRLPAEEQARVYEVCVARRPLVAKHWLQLMQHLERQKRPFEEIQRTLERAFGQQPEGQMSFDEGELVWLGYLESLRRYTLATDQPDPEKLRSNMRYVLTTMQTMYGDETETLYTILEWWARLEYRQLGDPARGRQIYEENIFQNSYNKSMGIFWLELIELESGRSPRPADKKLRELHKRSVKFTTDDLQCVCDRWLAFERDYGTLETLLQCKDTCQEALEKLKLERKKEAEQYEKKLNGKKKNTQNKKKDEKANESTGKGKKRAAEETSDTGEVKKRKEGVEVRQNGAKRGHGDTEDSAVQRKRKRLPKDDGDAEIMPPPSAPKAASASEPHAPADKEKDKEACTLFISNLDFKFNEATLRGMLSEWGTVAALRIVRGVKTFGGSICYCEYTTPEAVETAIKHDRAPLDGRPLFLSRYRSDRQKSKFKYATVTERNKLFVKNLPFTCCTSERLRDLFAEHGELVDVRIVAYKDGRPKGLAYVEYADEKSAATALQKTDGTLLEGRNIQVAYSAPPARDIPPAASLGQARRDTNAPRRTQLGGFVPRVLQKPTAAPSSAPSTSTAPAALRDPAAKSMSNSDFRNMLFNNK